MSKPRVLFLCTHNSARSQMAEGFLRAMAGDRFEAGSAGTERTSVNPLAVRAMAELGIDIGPHTSKQYDDVMHLPWDYVITVCDDAREHCPFMPGSCTGRSRIRRGPREMRPSASWSSAGYAIRSGTG